MKLSWSHKLFFQTNRMLGQSSALDSLIKFWAEYAIFLLGLAVLIGFWFATPDFWSFIWVNLRTGLALAVGVVISFSIAWVWPHHRPKVEFPEITELITPLSHWKSLPSDHSMIAWILVTAFLWFTHFAFCFDLLIIMAAIIICISRVFAGVHYPRDIVAGSALGWVVALVFFR